MTSPLQAPAALRAVLLDIEGTTTPIDFVFRTLFPFAKEHTESYLKAHQTEPQVADIITALSAEQDADTAAGNHPPEWTTFTREEEIRSAVKYVHWLMAQDRKSTTLKTLQGFIWEEGYKAGTLKGQVFSDVPPALLRWQAQGIATWIFSSGSVLAQKLLFAHSESGDLLPLLAGHFDTTTGPKREVASYAAIATAIGAAAEDVLFISDVVEELDAARDAGMQTLLSLRPGNKRVENNDHPTAENFNQVAP